MFAGQRLDIIRQVLRERKQIDIASLTTLLQVSDVTVRKDLDLLEKEGFLQKVHGGAILQDESPLDAERLPLPDEGLKEKLATLAITLIEDGDSLFLGSGSTCLVFAKQLSCRKALTVITNNASALPILCPHVANLHFIGGEVLCARNGLMHTYGKKALQHLNGVFVSKAFLGAEGLDLRAGLTTNHSPTVDLVQKVIDVSSEVIVLASHEKLGKVALHQIIPLNALSTVVSGGDAGDTYKQYFFEQNIKLLTAFDL